MKKQPFYDTSIYDLMDDCLYEVRRYVNQCPSSLDNKQGGGVVRFDFYPSVGSAGTLFRRWLSIPDDLAKGMMASWQAVHHIFPDDNAKVWVDKSNNRGLPDYSTVAEMRATSCKMRMAQKAGFDSGLLPEDLRDYFYFPEECGISEQKGAIAFVIQDRKWPQSVIGTMLVIVACGTPEEDDEIAVKSIAPVVNRFFEDSPEATIARETTHLD